MPRALLQRRQPKPRPCRLVAPGWNEGTRRSLQRLITDGAGQGLPAVFDFDNTLVGGDIGEATLALLARWGILTPAKVPRLLCPPLHLPGRPRVEIESCVDVTEYYEAFLAPTSHGKADSSPLANGYAWAVQVMEGLSPWDVLKATRAAFSWSDSANPGQLVVTPGRTAYPVPFFYAEMVELIAELLRQQFDVWIVSASNVWTVRWMALNALNPLLRAKGIRGGLKPDHVIGISTLLTDRIGRLHKDAVLVRENNSYARMDPRVLRSLKLTSQLQFPAPTYSGKIAALFDALGRNPYLAAGDSPGDIPLMCTSQHRLWIARSDKPRYQAALADRVKRTGSQGWMLQATIPRPGHGFVPETVEIPRAPRI